MDDPDPGFPDLEDDELELFTIRHRGEIAGMIQVYEETEPKYRYAALDLFVASAHQRQGVATERSGCCSRSCSSAAATTGSRLTRRSTTPRRSRATAGSASRRSVCCTAPSAIATGWDGRPAADGAGARQSLT